MTRAASAPSPTHMLTIGGGKGGVGKSVVACNLAVAFAEMGHKVVLADLDLGAANQHLLLGVMRPRPGVQGLLELDGVDPGAVLTPTVVPNLALLAGTGAVLGAANVTWNQKRRLMKKLRGLGADVVVVDVGAGVSFNALDFFNLGAQKVLVTTPQITALHDAYSFLKGAVLRAVRQVADKEIDEALLEPALRSAEAARVSDMLQRLTEQRPELAARVSAVLSRYNLSVIGNQVQHDKQAGVFVSVAKMVTTYLGIEAPLLGWLRETPRVPESVNARRPLALAGPSEEARTLRRMAQVLLSAGPVADEEVDIEVEEDPPPPRSPPPLPSGALADSAERADPGVAGGHRAPTLPGLTPRPSPPR